MHTNFVRGDKQRCLKIRSMVKKQRAQLQSFTGLAGGRLQAFGSNNQYGMMGLNVMGNAMAADQLSQHAPCQM